MLNLPIAMFPLKIAPTLLILSSLLQFFGGVISMAAFQGQDPPPEMEILSPQGGEALQGVVSVTGSTAVEGLRLVEVSFAYQTDLTETWFLIQQSTQPVQEGIIARWDTTTIADGEYRLRVQVLLQDGQVMEKEVSGLRVRNYSPVETSTPEVGASRPQTPTPTATPLPDFQVTSRSPKPEPTNPVQLSQRDLGSSALHGMLIVVAALAAAGIYLGLRSAFWR